MDTQAPGSFIPKHSMVPGAVGAPKSSGGGGLLTMGAVLVFIASLGAAGAAFGYEKVLKGQVQSKVDEIELNRSAFSVEGLDDLTRTDARLSETSKLLTAHIAPTLVFDLLSEQTLQKVQFTSFKFSIKKDGSASIDLSGMADSLQTVALQSDKLGEVKELKNILISGLTIGESGKILFMVKADMVGNAILYSKTLAPDTTDGASDVSVPPVETAPATPAASTTRAVTPSATPDDDALEF